jgi:hypothetical protein
VPGGTAKHLQTGVVIIKKPKAAKELMRKPSFSAAC